jgi:transcriptional regulator of acetoin/glycerol metabolism
MRDVFIKDKSIPEGAVPEAIERSWRRCAGSGLNMTDMRQVELAGSHMLKQFLESSDNLLRTARPVMENLYEQICNTGNMVILSDACGTLLHAIGDPDFVSDAQQVALQPGANWSEKERGTNAIGTALVEQQAVIVHASEHYLERNAFLTCSASPILDPYGRMMGVLDISGDYRSFHRHTLGLVRMSVQMIENRLITTEFDGEVTLTFHTRPEFLGTLCEGMIVFSVDGRFVAANRSALFQLGMNRGEMLKQDFASLFDLPFSEVLAQTRLTNHQPLTLHTHNGIRVFAKARSGTTVPPLCYVPYGRTPPTESRPSPVPAQPRAVTRKNLKTLDSLSLGDPKMEEAILRARKIMGRDIPLLIEGESGTGKELFANAFHCSSPRRDGPFVAMNCASIPEGLIESELFGYQEGAFTGAKRKGNPGKIQQAHGGTLFLDEIGDMPLNMQARLLRVLQERALVPLGGATPIPVDIAVVCATNRKLRDEVAAGSFRQDLYYRLNGLRIWLPPLRERKDLDQLVEFIIALEAGADHPVKVSDEVREIFRHYSWPGNIRQLSNVLRTSIALLDGCTIEFDHLPCDLVEDLNAGRPCDAGKSASAVMPQDEPWSARQNNLEEIEAQVIRNALKEHGGNISAAARQLGISRNTLYRKLGRF